MLSRRVAGNRGYHPEPLEPWAEDDTSDPNHDPDLWLLATDGNAPVGALTAGTEGRIGEIGVVRSHRG